MKLLQSKKMKLPPVYFITDRAEVREIPPGVPFIYADKKQEKDLVRILEYELLYQEAVRSGFPFNFKKILKDNGYIDLEKFTYETPVYMEFTSEGIDSDDGEKLGKLKTLRENSGKFKKYMKDSSVYVDIRKLKELNVFPIWLENIEEAVHTNIHNFAVYNENMYNKKLEGMYGSLELTSPGKNLIVIDISGSIPRGVSSTTLALSKTLAESFYADILITGSKSTIYPYETLHELDINTIYDENGMDNDQAWFKKLVTRDERKYETAIVFGDNHSPCYAWSNQFNRSTRTISREDGRKMCKWEIKKLISFHTSNRKEDDTHIAGYADWFEPEETVYIHDWVKYL